MKYFRLLVPILFGILILTGCGLQSGENQRTVTLTQDPPEPTETRLPTPTPTTVDTATLTPTPLPPPVRSFEYTVHSSEEHPALTKPEDEDSWEGDYTWSPFVVYHEGIFHMFYNGYDTIPRSIGYAISEDGITFTRYPDNPVLEFSAITNSYQNMIIGPVVYVQDDGTWVMYVVDSRLNLNLAGSAVSRYTAPTPTGPWTMDGEQVFVSEEGSWTEEIVLRSVLVEEDGSILLAFDARYDVDTVGIGLMRSEDGISFELVSDEPVLVHGPEGSWYPGGPGAPMLFATEDGYEMFFLGFEIYYGRYRGYQGNNLWVGYATSPDGIEWEVDAHNPVIQIPDTNGFAYMSGMKLDGTYFLYYVFRAGADGIGVLTTTIEPLE